MLPLRSILSSSSFAAPFLRLLNHRVSRFADSRPNEARRHVPLSPRSTPATLKRSFAASSAENKDSLWDAKFDLLYRYKREHGDCNVPRSYRDGENRLSWSLGRWVDKNRQEFRKLRNEVKGASTLTSKQISKPEAIGVDFDPLGSLWSGKFELLCQYNQQHGNCLVPEQYTVGDKKLGRWITQLQDGKPSAMTRERVDKLDAIGQLSGTCSWSFCANTKWNMLETALCLKAIRQVEFDWEDGA